MKRKRTTENDIMNVITERFLFNRFKLLALNMFEYEGLEDTMIEERHIENFLFDEGKCFWFQDKDYGLMCLPCLGVGANVYNDPLAYRVTGHGYSTLIRADKGVLMENNKLRMATHDIIKYFTAQLYEVVRARDINIKTLKLPFMLGATPDNEFTVKRILDKIDDNCWAIVTDKTAISLEEVIKVLPTNVKPFTAELTDVYHDIMNEALTYLGINNANTDKKERLITDEANANNQFIDSCAQMFLEARKRACEQINEMFGTNISVKLRTPGGDENESKLLDEYATNGQQSNND